MPQKAWTLLIYANGNNDLEPEIRQALLKVQQVDSNQDVNVLMQLGRAKRSIVKILRPNDTSQTTELWSGVRRYHVGAGKSDLVASLGEINMADPKRLYEFIKWGLQTYPAERYMLILSGHGYQCTGALIDYSRKAPYIMGIPEMAEAMNRAGEELKKKIDLLILDVCHFNCIEVIYELAKYEKPIIQNMITYIDSGPIVGLSYEKLIILLQQNAFSDNLSIIRNLIDELPNDLVAFETNHRKVEQLKSIFSRMAYSYCFEKNLLLKSPDELSAMLLSLVIYFKRVTRSNSALISIVNKPLNDSRIIARYNKLSFSKKNYWISLLSNKTVNPSSSVESKIQLHPLKLTFQDVYALIRIMNPELTAEKQQEIAENLYKTKKWPRLI